MSTTLERLSAVDASTRSEFFSTLGRTEKAQFASLVDTAMGSPYGEFRYDPIGFVNEQLGEPTWSKMQAILDSVLKYKITCVPAGHSVSKSHTAARVVAWWNSVHAPGTALTITTATTFPQVKTILWPHIRKMVTRHELPGWTNQTEWIIPTADDRNYQTAYGFSAADNDESAVQGRHAPHLLIIVDEAGGVSHELGKALWSLLTGGHTRMLLIGNPSTEEENTWFQKRCESGAANTNVIPIPVFDTPNFTGEDAGMCHSCPPGTEPHSAATHMVDQQWLREVVEEFGANSPYIEARAYARFPEYIQDKVLPLTWLEGTLPKMFPEDDTGAPGPVAIGADIASDGGDEFVIARRIGNRAKVVYAAAGAANENSEDVADRIAVEVEKGKALHDLWKINQKVRVKIDAIGVGWGVVSNLQRRYEKDKQVEIIGVNVAETAIDSEKFANKRAEMWWNLRTLVQPTLIETSVGGSVVKVPNFTGDVRLDIDTKTLAQLSAPMYSASGGKIIVEKKSQIKKRTNGKSPDRGEAILLAFYEISAVTIDEAIPFRPSELVQSSGWAQA